MINTFSLEQVAKTGDLKTDLIMRRYKLDKMANFMEINSINPKLKQYEIAKELAMSTSTSQRYRREINMHSPYRVLQSLNTNTRKQQTSNYTEQNLKVTSNDLKMTSYDLKETLKESGKSNRRSKLRRGNPNGDNATQGSFPIEQAFSPT